MAWQDAHQFCRSRDGFLPSESQLSQVSQVSQGSPGALTWTALTPHHGHYQWLSRCPTASQFVSWGERPPRWSRECAAYNATGGEFHLTECTTRLVFHCVLNGSSSDTAPADPFDVELRVESLPRAHLGWLDLGEEEFKQLTLTCRAFKRSTGELMEPQPPVFWSKDGAYNGMCGDSLEPYTSHDPTKSDWGQPNEPMSEQQQTVVSQGVVWCESWLPDSHTRVTSNKVLVTLEEWLVLVLNAHLEEPPGRSVDEVKERLQVIFKDQFDDITSCIMDPISVEKQNVGLSVLANYSFHLHVPKKNLSFHQKFDELFSIWLKVYNRIIRDDMTYGFLPSSNVQSPTYCTGGTQDLESGVELVWPFTKAGNIHPKNVRCRVKYGRLSPGVCGWNYTHGARVKFDSTECEWADLCPKGYKDVAGKYCVNVSNPDTWKSGFSQAYRTGQEYSVLDKLEFFSAMGRRKSLSLYDSVKEVVGVNYGGKIWLPLARKRRFGPLQFMGPQRTRFTPLQSTYQHPYNISWRPGHPRSDHECLALDTTNNTLETAACSERRPFVVVVESSFITADVSEWKPLFSKGDSCPPRWLTTVFKGQYTICFRLFHDAGNLTWDEANQFCDSNDAQLATPNVGFLDWVYRQQLYTNSVSDVWMGVVRRHGRLVYNGPQDHINWLADTNYSQAFGVLTVDGWNLSGAGNRKPVTMCQQILDNQAAMTLRINEPRTASSQTMCIDAEPKEFLMTSIPSNPRCYVNGKYIQHEQTSDSGCQYELKLNGQGYYQCQAWAHPPFELVESNTIIHRDPATLTYVVSLRQDKDYDAMLHDKTFLMGRRSGRIPDTCSEVFMAWLRSSNMTDDFRFTNKDFFHSPSPEGKLLQNFHLECEIQDITASMITEQDFFSILNRLFPQGMSMSDCQLYHIRSTVGCPSDVTLDTAREEPRQLTWVATEGSRWILPQELCINTEGEPVTRECVGDFFEGYHWDEPSGGCTGEPSYVTKQLWKISNKPLQDFNDTSLLANLTSNSTDLKPIDIHFIATTLDSFSRDVRDDTTLDLEYIVGIMNNVMGADDTVFEPIQWKLNSSSTLLEAFEQLTFQVQLPKVKGDQTKNSSMELISVERLDLEANSTIIGFKSTPREDDGERRVQALVKGVNADDLNDAEVAIILPNNLTFNIAETLNVARSVVEDEDKVQVTFAVYRNEKLFQETSTNYSVNSHIIQAAYRGKTIIDLIYPVKLLFRPLKDGNDTKCVYWDFAKNGGRGGWSGYGCWPGKKEGQHDVCYCNHLTSFAQLINYDEDSHFTGRHAIILDIITIIGCCLSIIGLLLVFATFFLFKKWRRSLSNKILVNLSFAVFCSMVIFLSGINQTWNTTLCRGVAVGLHYFILASFGWMLVEAVHQYFKFVKVVGTYIPRFMWKASVCAWGIPVLPILVVLIIDSSLYDNGTDNSHNVQICWMSVDAFTYAFLPPLALTMIVNLIIFSLIIHGAVCGRARVKSNMSERTIFMNQLRMAVCVFFLLGFTWIFGLLAIRELRPVFSYLFCIFNTLQGFFLFLFHVFRERSARRLWSDFLSVLTKDPVSTSPMNSFNPAHSGFHRNRDSVSFDKCGAILVLPQGPPIRSHHLRSNRRDRASLLSARTTSTIIPSRASYNP